MTSVLCLTLIMYMEARSESPLTQSYVASVAIERAKQENKSICESMKTPRAYSWLWDGVNTKVNQKHFEKIKPLATRQLQSPALRGHTFFNERKLGKRFKTHNKPITSGNLIFY